MDSKVIAYHFSRFEETLPKWSEVIYASFLPDEMKMAYKDNVTDMATRLRFEGKVQL